MEATGLEFRACQPPGLPQLQLLPCPERLPRLGVIYNYSPGASWEPSKANDGGPTVHMSSFGPEPGDSSDSHCQDQPASDVQGGRQGRERRQGGEDMQDPESNFHSQQFQSYDPRPCTRPIGPTTATTTTQGPSATAASVGNAATARLWAARAAPSTASQATVDTAASRPRAPRAPSGAATPSCRPRPPLSLSHCPVPVRAELRGGRGRQGPGRPLTSRTWPSFSQSTEAWLCRGGAATTTPCPAGAGTRRRGGLDGCGPVSMGKKRGMRTQTSKWPALTAKETSLKTTMKNSGGEEEFCDSRKQSGERDDEDEDERSKRGETGRETGRLPGSSLPVPCASSAALRTQKSRSTCRVDFIGTKLPDKTVEPLQECIMNRNKKIEKRQAGADGGERQTRSFQADRPGAAHGQACGAQIPALPGL
uniref:Uncharacterized protein n=1 Tax=Oryctolagus cuniculus TaxID=9986 RepID=G1TIG1_RABIT